MTLLVEMQEASVNIENEHELLNRSTDIVRRACLTRSVVSKMVNAKHIARIIAISTEAHNNGASTTYCWSWCCRSHDYPTADCMPNYRLFADHWHIIRFQSVKILIP